MADRTIEHLVRPRTAGWGGEVFATEATAAQAVWSALPEGRHELRLVPDRSHRGSGHGRAARSVTIDSDGGPGSVVLEELDPDMPHVVELAGAVRSFRTLAAPPGEELFRFATVSDLHLGRGERPYRGPLAHLGTHEHTAAHESTATHESTAAHVPTDSDRSSPAAAAATPAAAPALTEATVDRQFRCAAAAVDEALAWGAELLVVKGDVCEESYDWIWDQAAALLGSLPVPVRILPGNHDTGRLRQIEPEVAARERGLHLTRGVEHLDVPGLRILLVDSTRPGNGWGAVARHAEQAADLAVEASTGVFVATHHHPQRVAPPLFWPHGIPGPDANRFARAVVAANPAVLASSGHTHRCRRRDVAGLEWTEVAATNHFPGVWAGYTVYDGGIAQTVRRISAPDALAWTERTRPVLGGVWALWSTGTLSDRCFSRTW